MSQDKECIPLVEELRERDSDVVLRPWSGDPPVPIVRARGCTVTDADGRDYLDFTSGYFVNQVGHCHPRIVQAATEQMHKVMQVSGKHATPVAIALAERLIEIAPEPLHKTFFATGGSEAIEFALKMVRQNKRLERVAYLDNAYHGLTLGALEVTASQAYRASAGVELAPEHAVQLPTPYCYRCAHVDDCQTQCVDELEAVLDEHPDTAALIAEPMQAVGGLIPPERWWARVDALRRRRGLLLILDEIQTGLGRTGLMFAAEHYGLEPDILAAGKGLSGGVGALSVVLTSEEIAHGFYGGTTPTNAGNAVSAAAGLALIETLIDEDLLANCTAMGRHLSDAVRALDDPWVGDVRMRGLFGGIELVFDRTSKEVLGKAQVLAVQHALQERGVLLTVTGPHHNVLRLQPPLCITAQQVDTFVVSLDTALSRVRDQGGLREPSEIRAP